MGAGVLALGRRSRSRLQWALAVAVGVAAWFGTLAGWRYVPAALAVSAWRPEGVFLDRVQLMLDPVGWPIQLAVVSALLAGLLWEPVAAIEGDRGRAGTLALAAAGLAAIQAGNILTVALTWAVLDVTGGVLPTLADPSEAPRARWVVNSAGVLLVLGAVIGLPEGGLGRGLSNLGTSPLAAGLVLGGAGLRLGAARRSPGSGDGAARKDTGYLLRILLPPAACMAALGRVLGTAEGPLATWAALLGVFGCVIGSFTWFNDSETSDSLPALALGLAGVAGVAGSTHAPLMGSVWAASGVLFIGTGALSFVWRPFAEGFRWAPRWGALALAGLPFTAGALLAGGLLAGAHGVLGWVLGMIGLGALVVMALGLWKRAGVQAESWPNVERMVRVAYAGGVLLLLATLTLTYAPLLRGIRDDSRWLGSGIGVGLFIGAVLLRGRWSWGGRPRGARAARWLDPAPILAAIVLPFRLLLGGVGRLADLLEGEAAVLWIYIIVLALSLASGLGR